MKRGGIIFLMLLLSKFVSAQIITTFAGTGSSVFSGNGVSATTAGIPNPRGGAVDKHGNLYFTDGTGSHRVRKIDVSGIILTTAGTGVGGYDTDGVSATAAKLYYPTSIIFDTIGNYYIADVQNYRVRKVNILTGDITTVAGNGVPGFAGDGGQATAANITGPADICLDKLGNLYIADAFNYRIRKVNTAGIISTIAGIGTMGSSGDGGAATAAEINIPQGGLAIDTMGNIYVAERGGNRVRKINNLGIITTIAGNGSPTYSGDGIPATSAQIVPLRIGFDTSWQLYIADDYNQRIYKIDNSGIIHNVIGNGTPGYSGDGGPATAAQINGPGGIAFDQCGNLYFPEVTNRRIRKVTFNPTCDLESLNTNAIHQNENVSIYPNPTNNELHINNVKPGTKYDVVSIVDAVVHSGTLKAKENTISIRNLPPGIYMLALTNEQGIRTVHKIIKE